MPKPDPTLIHLRWTTTQSLSSPAYDVLDEDERAMAARLPEHARSSYIAAHALLRLTLSEFEDRSPQSWRWTYGPHGKPYAQDSSLHFNLSHSTTHAVVAVSAGAQLGIDVEEISPHRADEEIARQLFAADEYEMWCGAEDRTQTFFQIWTLKEAYMKATGLGAALPLQDFSIRLSPPQLIHRKAQGEIWQLFSQVLETKAVIGLAAKPDEGRALKITERQVFL